jgi:hypothetical protein
MAAEAKPPVSGPRGLADHPRLSYKGAKIPATYSPTEEAMPFILADRRARTIASLLLTVPGLLALLFVLTPPSAPRRVRADDPPPCGTERWSVKTGTDPDVGLVDLSNPLFGSINRLCTWPRPSSVPPNNRIPPFETRAYVVLVTLTQYKLESDADYHLVLVDGQGNSLIGEIPDPACVGSTSPFKNFITTARNQFKAKFTNISTSWHYTNTTAMVMGVGFFDFVHGQTGHAPNYVELHPVLDIQFP